MHNPPLSYALGLIGYPLEGSRSPQLHKAALTALGLTGEYSLIPIPPVPAGDPELALQIQKLRSGALHGLNVTIPHKRSIIPHLDSLTATAAEIGAVNTLYLENGAVVGDNTDAAGFLSDLNHLWGLPASGSDKATSSGFALVLGAGGAARAVSYALWQAGWQVVLAARRLEGIQTWVDGLRHPEQLLQKQPGTISAVHLDPQSIQMLAAELPPHTLLLIVNASSAGMIPDVESTAWPEGLPLPDGAIIYDLVYKPQETRLLREARLKGLVAANGLGMLVEQAALSFEHWTGRKAPRANMRQVVGLDAPAYNASSTENTSSTITHPQEVS